MFGSEILNYLATPGKMLLNIVWDEALNYTEWLQVVKGRYNCHTIEQLLGYCVNFYVCDPWSLTRGL